MKIAYYPDTDLMYIDLSEKPSSESREVSITITDQPADFFHVYEGQGRE